MWRSYHLYYYSNRRYLIRTLVRPLVAKLLARGEIDRFFYIYYPLGGPHVRLRLRVLPDATVDVDRLVLDTAAAFFSRWPSNTSIDPAALYRQNRRILAGAPIETDANVYPNNSLRILPYEQETERYGGIALVAHSLDFFTLSSAQALQFAEELGDLSWGRQLTEAFRLLVRQAWGIADTPRDFLRLLRYRLISWREEKEPAIRRGKLEFNSRPETYSALLRAELESLACRLPLLAADPTDPLILAEGALRLANEIEPADHAAHRRIGNSQMHMTANRLAMSREEEIYLCMLMWKAACSLAKNATRRWRELTHPMDSHRRRAISDSLRDLLPPVFANLSRSAPISYEFAASISISDKRA